MAKLPKPKNILVYTKLYRVDLYNVKWPRWHSPCGLSLVASVGSRMPIETSVPMVDAIGASHELFRANMDKFDFILVHLWVRLPLTILLSS